ncbi:MAG TPA: GHMP kinase, partial [Bacillota bacterium]
MRVLATAPNRIDLAGGTLDLYPLYLLLDGGLTINAAVSIASRVEAWSRDDGRIVIRSQDTGTALEAEGYDDLPLEGPLALAARAARYWRPPGGCELLTANQAPRGSGLGASSALLVALCAALAALCGEPPARDRLVRVAADLEAQVIGVPTG